MIEKILIQFSQIISEVHPILMFFVILSFGMYVFWKGCARTRKENTSVFDMFIFSTIFGVVGGRISYILSHWSEFSDYIWYWLPYEKYGDQIFLFRVLPWRFFRFWDWGIDLMVMFVSFLIVASLWTIFMKKWKWSHLFSSIFFSMEIMLGISFFVLGGLITNKAWIAQGFLMLSVPLVLFFLQNVVRKRVQGKRELKILSISDSIVIIGLSIYVAYIYLTTDVILSEKIASLVLLAWSVLGSIVYINKLQESNVTIEKVSNVNTISRFDINQPIKLRK